MAYNSIPDSLYDIGNPVVRELWETTDANFEDHEDRLNGLESTASKVQIFNGPIFNLAQYANGNTLDQIWWYKAQQDISLIEFQLLQTNPGLSGVLEADLRIGNDLSAVSSVMSVKPSLAPGDGANAESSNQIFAANNVTAGQFIALYITQVQIGQGRISVVITGEPT